MNFKNISDDIKSEILDYTRNKFIINDNNNFDVKDESFIQTFRELIEEGKENGMENMLNDNFPHGETDIKLQDPSGIKLEIYKSIAGNIPIFYTSDPKDFEELVSKIVHKGKDVPHLDKTGASFVFGKTLRFIILSNKPYSNIEASELCLDDTTWRKYSMIIRRDHECTHYFTKRFLNSSSNNIHDELIADFAGICSAYGKYMSKWFLRGMGIDKYPEPQKVMRFPVYTKELSEQAKDILKLITIKAAKNVEKWSEEEKVKSMTQREKVLFLCQHSLLQLHDMYD